MKLGAIKKLQQFKKLEDLTKFSPIIDNHGEFLNFKFYDAFYGGIPIQLDKHYSVRLRIIENPAGNGDITVTAFEAKWRQSERRFSYEKGPIEIIAWKEALTLAYELFDRQIETMHSRSSTNYARTTRERHDNRGKLAGNKYGF